MANARRGEIDGVLDGKRYRLCLTLGALAELEHAFGDEDMLALTRRFESGRIAARDAMRVIAAGLRGGGLEVSDEDVASMRADGGVAGYIDIVARLLAATFGGGDGRDHSGEPAAESRRAEGGATASGPFPGTR